METELKKLIGKKVLKVFMNQEYLKFETDNGNLVYSVVGDCCSNSFFYDFYGVTNLIGRVVKEVKEVELHPTDLFVTPDKGDCTSVYGYSITLEPKEDDYYGESTAVFSFRNESNGYYGGWIFEKENDIDGIPEITNDVVEVK
jgi:hypothetical protein